MRTAVFGAGGIGGYLGGRLAESGEELVVIARGAHQESIEKQGLKIDSINGDIVVNPQIITNDPTKAGKVDIIILGVKAWQVAEAAKAMVPMMTSDTIVVTVQNGVLAPIELAEHVGANHVVIGLCMLRSFIVGPGHLKHSMDVYPNVQFGEIDGSQSERIMELKNIFEGVGLSVVLPKDINVALWEKFLVFSVASAMGALTRSTTGVWRSMTETRKMAETLVTEIVSVGKSRGIDLSDKTIIDTMLLLDTWDHNHTTSMAKDMMEGRPSELDAAIGNIVKLGIEKDVDVSLNNLIYNTLLLQENQARQ